MEYRHDGMVECGEGPEHARRAVPPQPVPVQRRSYNLTMLSVFDEPVMDTNCTRRIIPPWCCNRSRC